MNAALDASAFGDTVLVAPGTYSTYDARPGMYSSMAFIPDGVVLRSEGGKEVTELVHSSLPTTLATTFWIQGATSGATTIEGFTVISTATTRGGCYVRFGSVTVRSCTFVGLDWRAVDLFDSDAIIEDCEFRDCLSVMVGGAINTNEGQVWITGCSFVNCSQGAVSLTGTFGGHPDYAEIRDCMFDGNTTVSDGGGLRIANYDLGAIVEGCTFVNNTAGSGGGGAAVVGLGASIVDCVFQSNEAVYAGGGLYCGSLPGAGNTVTACTFHGNVVTAPIFAGGTAVAFTSPGSVLSSSIVEANSGASAVAVLSSATLASSCNVFWNNTGGIGIPLSPTDRTLDPLFCDPANGDLTLREDSPCLPANSAGCGLIGALGQGCGVVSLKSMSWGALKSSYRQ